MAMPKGPLVAGHPVVDAGGPGHYTSIPAAHKHAVSKAHPQNKGA